ncbi:MAG: phytanoyl-CoA dioxygenase family protein, partial [Alphaproteobacteria bacterium]|nr:phytanoyl-CoA dioxygenase family protein [Alphaproteobacteria bacterium]
MSSFSMREEFEENGFVIAKGVITLPLIQQIKKDVFKNIKKCAKELNVSEREYLSAVSRWVDPSCVTSNIPSSLLTTLADTTKNIVKDIPHLHKLNIICKNAYCTGSVPFHQDISYSPQDPYQLSAWLALDEITEDSGPLEVIPKSHLGPILPAVDFWSPEYSHDLSIKKNVKKLSLNLGDVVLFDSRLWHGSSEKKDLAPRYALVTRWSSQDWKLSQEIPPLSPKFFGMWTSGKMAQEMLMKGAQVLLDKKVNDFVKLIEIWMEALRNYNFPFYIHTERAIESLTNIKILHLAH